MQYYGLLKFKTSDYGVGTRSMEPPIIVLRWYILANFPVRRYTCPSWLFIFTCNILTSIPITIKLQFIHCISNSFTFIH